MGIPVAPVRGLVVCPGVQSRAEMIRLLQRLDIGGQWYSAPGMDAAVQLYRSVKVDLIWVHELADSQFRFVRFFGEGRAAAVAVLLDNGPDATEQVNRAFRAGATAVFDSSGPDAATVKGLRAVMRGNWYVSPSLDSRPRRSAVVASLTERECQVLRLMAEGLQNRQIAHALFISVDTVRTHVKNTLRKLNAGNRTEVVARAFCLGILQPSDFPSAAEHVLEADAETLAEGDFDRVGLPGPEAGVPGEPGS